MNPRRGGLLVILVAASAAVACRQQKDAKVWLSSDGGTVCQGLPTPSIDDLWTRYLAANPTSGRGGCASAGCHLDGSGNLPFSTAAEFVAATVGIASSKVPTVMRIVPGDPASSYLYYRLTSAAGVLQMPASGAYLDDDDRAEIAGWICAGAPGSQLDLGAPDEGVAADLAVAAPTITSFTPAQGAAGDRVTISGSGFASTASNDAVAFAGVAAAAPTSASATSLVVTVPAGAATGRITVTTAGGAATSANDFVVVPKPTITSIAPTVVLAGAPAQTLTVGGTGFVAASEVFLELGGATTPLSTHYASMSTLSADLPAAALASGAAYSVIVSNLPPSAALSNALPFTVDNPSPTLTTISPATVPTGGPAYTMTVNGGGFDPASTVTWTPTGGAATLLTTHFVAPTQLVADVPQTLIASSGTAAVTVVNPTPGGGTSAALTVTVSACSGTPILTSIAPTVAATNTTFTLTASGGCFVCGATPSAAILLGTTIEPTTLGACSGGYATQATAMLANLSAGAYTVTIKNPSGASSAGQTLTIQTPNPVPAIASISPTDIAAGAPAFTLSVYGSGFVSGATVIEWNGAPRTTQFVSSSQVTASISSADVATAGMVAVAAFNPAPGGGTSAPVSFTIVNAPAISSLSPSTAGLDVPPPVVKIMGSSFVSGATASFNGAARPTTFVSAGEVDMALQAGDTSRVGDDSVVVVNPDGIGSNTATFTIQYPQPVITLLVASSTNSCGVVASSSSFVLTISGSGFYAGATVSITDASGASTYPATVISLSSTSISASVTIASAPPGDYAQVVVSNPSPSGGPSTPAILGVATQATTIASVVSNVFSRNCVTGCHNGSSPNTLPGSMDLRTAISAAAALIGVTSVMCPPELRVLRCDPRRASSFVVDKISATSGSRACGNSSGTAGNPMPPTGAISAAQEQQIIDWVAQGAP